MQANRRRHVYARPCMTHSEEMNDRARACMTFCEGCQPSSVSYAGCKRCKSIVIRE